MKPQQTQLTLARAQKDYLTSMPPEVLFKIISYLLSSSWGLPLVKAYHNLRLYIRQIAAQKPLRKKTLFFWDMHSTLTQDNANMDG